MSIFQYLPTGLIIGLSASSVSLAQPLSTSSEGLSPAMQLRAGPETRIPLSRLDGEQGEVVIDGVIDEAAWEAAGNVPGLSMRVVEPETLAATPYNTDFKVFYNDQGLYIAVDMEQPEETLVRRISGRDARGIRRDRVSFTIDTSGNGRFGYWMSLALGDNQMDGTILPERQYSSEWDGAWYGATSETENGWSAEFYIPWGQLAMPDSEGEERAIGFYAQRNVGSLDETWGWPGIPGSDSLFLSDYPRLTMEGVDPRQQWSVFPYASTTVDEVDNDVDGKAGVDLFWRPSSNFQATATINPDFGSAESDDVVVNLTANETFFPEKRLFFQEGQEIFNTTPRSTGSGGKRLSIINTRRIGGRPRTPDLPPGESLSARQRVTPADLLGAAKFTGQSGSVRYGVLTAMEDDTDYDVGGTRVTADGRDFGAVRMLYEDSRNAAYRGLGYIGTTVRHPDRSADVHAVDYHYLSTSGRWNVDGQVIASDVEGVGTGYGTFADVVYQPQQGVRHTLQMTYLDDTIDVNDFGFLERNNSWEFWYRGQWIFTDLDVVRNVRLSPFLRYEENLDGDRTNNAIPVFNVDVTLNNLDQVSFGLFHFPKRYDDRNSFGNGTFAVAERTNFNVNYTTDPGRAVSFEVGAGQSGEFAGGTSHNLSAGVTWRPIDNLNFSSEVEYDDRDGWLLHQEDQNFTAFDSEQWRSNLSMEYYLTAKQQFSAALQWVGIKADEDRFYHLPADAPTRNRDLIQVDKPAGPTDSFALTQMNLQLRYRWQIAPLSDLFVVYSKSNNQRGMIRSFDDQFGDAWDDPLVSQLVVKLRYRFGT